MKNLFWKMHLKSSPEEVFQYLTTDEGREAFWAYKSIQRDNSFELTHYDGSICEVLTISKTKLKFEFIYNRTIVAINLIDDGNGGTELLLNNKNIQDDDYEKVSNKWISTLLSLKAACDFKIDIRNQDPSKSYDIGYIDF